MPALVSATGAFSCTARFPTSRMDGKFCIYRAKLMDLCLDPLPAPLASIRPWRMSLGVLCHTSVYTYMSYTFGEPRPV